MDIDTATKTPSPKPRRKPRVELDFPDADYDGAPEEWVPKLMVHEINAFRVRYGARRVRFPAELCRKLEMIAGEIDEPFVSEYIIKLATELHLKTVELKWKAAKGGK